MQLIGMTSCLCARKMVKNHVQLGDSEAGHPAASTFGKFSTTCVGTEILHGSIAGRISCESTILETLGSQTHTDNADQ